MSKPKAKKSNGHNDLKEVREEIAQMEHQSSNGDVREAIRNAVSKIDEHLNR